jgi:hypothetical protein
VDIAKESMIASLVYPKEREMDTGKSEVLQGTLDMMILKTLHALGPLHGFGIARRIEQLSDGLHIAAPSAATRLDRIQMGHLGK